MSNRKRPQPKSFDAARYRDIVAGLTENMNELAFEEACSAIAIDILQKHEQFDKVEPGPNLKGRPFDFFGYKDGRPYIIELKSSLKSFNAPGEVQKRRMQEILDAIDGLNIALLQIKLLKGQYRIFYNEQMNVLFEGRRVPIEPIIEWVRQKVK